MTSAVPSGVSAALKFLSAALIKLRIGRTSTPLDVGEEEQDPTASWRWVCDKQNFSEPTIIAIDLYSQVDEPLSGSLTIIGPEAVLDGMVAALYEWAQLNEVGDDLSYSDTDKYIILRFHEDFSTSDQMGYVSVNDLVLLLGDIKTLLSSSAFWYQVGALSVACEQRVLIMRKQFRELFQGIKAKDDKAGVKPWKREHRKVRAQVAEKK